MWLISRQRQSEIQKLVKYISLVVELNCKVNLYTYVNIKGNTTITCTALILILYGVSRHKVKGKAITRRRVYKLMTMREYKQ